jgi:hypothetical protein
MRVERRGGPPDLQAAFKSFILTSLLGRALDDNQAKEAAEGQFPDFTCFRNLVLIEMKHLETDQHDRINKLIEAKIDPAEKPIFYGSREARFVTDAVSNGAAINAAIASKLGRTIETILSKANRQFASYRSRHPRKNSVSVCVILNSILREYTPDVVIHAVHGKMKTSQSGEPRFPEIDAVLYISEKHFQVLPDGRMAYGLAIYEAAGAINQPWKTQFVDRIVDAWSRMRTGDSAVDGRDLYGFETVHDIPASVKGYEAWQLEYQRDPYMSSLTVERLRMLFHRMIAVNSLTFIKGNWPKPPQQEVADGMRIFQHIIEETNRHRGDESARTGPASV